MTSGSKSLQGRTSSAGREMDPYKWPIPVFWWIICSIQVITGDQCVSHVSQCFNITLTAQVFVCPSRGRFPHPENAWMFYKCSRAEARPCVCACGLGRIFDPEQKTCHHRTSVSGADGNVYVKEQPLNFRRQPDGDTITTASDWYQPTTEPRAADEKDSGQMAPLYATSRPVRLVNRRQRALRTLLPIQDGSSFPAWAIALLVVIGVIVMMSVVLVMY